MLLRNPLKYLALAALISAITACGDDSPVKSDPPKQAKVTATNANSLALTTAAVPGKQSIENAAAALDSIFGTNSTSIGTSGNSAGLGDLMCLDTAGTVTVTDNSTEATFAYSIVFDNYCLQVDVNNQVILNGTLSMGIIAAIPPIDTTTTTYSFTFTDFTITAGGISKPLNCSMQTTLDNKGNISTSDTCGISDGTFDVPVDSTNSSFNTDGLRVTKTNTGGFTIEGTLYTPEGYLTVTTPSAITFDSGICPTAPTGGEIEILGSNNSRAKATFINSTGIDGVSDSNCSYEICVYNDASDTAGTCTPKSWPTVTPQV